MAYAVGTPFIHSLNQNIIMTLKSMQAYLLTEAYWIGDWSDDSFDPNDYIREDSDLRKDLKMNDDNLIRLFGVTNLTTVRDCMDLLAKAEVEDWRDENYQDEFPFEVEPEPEPEPFINFHPKYRESPAFVNNKPSDFSYKTIIKSFKS